jgi:hypothetical protein
MKKMNEKEILESNRYMGANLYVKEKPIGEFKKIDADINYGKNTNENIYGSHNNENINEIKVSEDSDGKKVYLGFPTTKRTIIIFCLFVLIPTTVFFLVIPTVNYNGVPTNMSMLSRIGMLLYIWTFSIAVYYYALKPFSITFIKKYDGHIYIEKQMSFYIKKKYLFNNQHNLNIIGKKGRVFRRGIRLVTFLIPKYKMLLRYNIDGGIEEIDLSFSMSYYQGGMGRDMGFFKKEQLVEIADSLGLPLILE